MFVLDRLDADDRAAVQAHLDCCPACRSEVERLAPVVELLSRADPRLILDEHLRTRKRHAR